MKGTDAVQGIFLNIDVQLSSQAFRKMYNLRTLITKYEDSDEDCNEDCDDESDEVYDEDCEEVHLHNGDLDYLPDELRYLHWKMYPLEILPSVFNPVNLVELDISRSNIKQLWKGRTCVPKLKRLNLGDCEKLISIPDLSDIPSAESINLKRCISLLEIHSSRERPKKLHSLRLSDCKNLSRFPSNIHIEGSEFSLHLLPPLSGLCSLKELRLNNSSLTEISEDIGCLSSLEKLELHGNVFERLPKSIKQLSKLYYLSLYNCGMLRSLPELPSSLRFLEAMNCKELIQSLPDESEIELCANGGGSFIFNFMNCLKLNQKAVSNLFRDSLLKMQLMGTEKIISLFKVSPPP
ncbi:hypothetical protein Ddye_019701 [Dipteronia dyeriana]|uniref:Uncharacterized protein n=1 Tax=Dipteronia dyeriana TaxID=168575 RepID=A0AAD9WVC1_9ROSI|nr:hypothetical protein Ddye_019701 [Dipteronia dyeriana]